MQGATLVAAALDRISDAVTGNTSVHLVQVPWDQAIDIVAKSKGLQVRRERDVRVVEAAGH